MNTPPTPIATVKAALAPWTWQAHRLLKVIRTAGSLEAVAVARFDFARVQKERRLLRARLAGLARQRDAARPAPDACSGCGFCEPARDEHCPKCCDRGCPF